MGRKVYNERCYFCHGYSGTAKTVAAGYLAPPPRDFTRQRLPRARMLQAVTDGKPGTGMMPFKTLLSPAEIAAVVDYIRATFMRGDTHNTHYHTPANGWPEHERYRAAFPFALGQIPLDTPETQLNDAQRTGKRLFMESCVTCHEGSRLVR